MDNWLRLTELADKLDWVFPLEVKTQMMKDQPQHQAGGCKVSWEKDENEDDEDDEDQEGGGCTLRTVSWCGWESESCTTTTTSTATSSTATTTTTSAAAATGRE